MLRKFLQKAHIHFDLAEFLLYWLARIYVNRCYIPEANRNQNYINIYRYDEIKEIPEGDYITVNIQYHDGRKKFRYEPDFSIDYTREKSEPNQLTLKSKEKYEE